MKSSYKDSWHTECVMTYWLASRENLVRKDQSHMILEDLSNWLIWNKAQKFQQSTKTHLWLVDLSRTQVCPPTPHILSSQVWVSIVRLQRRAAGRGPRQGLEPIWTKLIFWDLIIGLSEGFLEKYFVFSSKATSFPVTSREASQWHTLLLGSPFDVLEKWILAELSFVFVGF